MKKILIYICVLILVVVMIWPEQNLKIASVVDGNTVELNNGTTVHLIGVNSTNEGKIELEGLMGKSLLLVPDKTAFFNPDLIDKTSTVYAYAVVEDDNVCINASLLKNRYSNLEENSYLNDSLNSFRKYAESGRRALTPEPTPTPKPVIDYQEEEIYLDPYIPSSERKHSAWYNDGSMNLEMLEEACDFNLPYTKKFANELAARSPGSFNPGQICEIFAYCYKKWSYVNDPADVEYVARASETIHGSLIGDCDDYAVLMASCILAVGGRACINTGYNSSGGHAFTEVDISNFDENEVYSVICKYFPEYNIQNLNYRIDGQHKWLNLDWQTQYPGGKYYDCSYKWDSYPYEKGKWVWKKLR
ncbi:MAG: transglutaminase domain-containing protein [Bacteroidales bacterium]|nr:transglutaminase domain-containing protein [Bacteroidales bacterium]